ncbi:MAG TPA: hypothetical protein VNV43_03485 [Candidatus Acidoferrales bacterium]|jgi:hypothetical protein|nr:hypothetical protein [Candidatus Acidoferrales bacterium]
MDNNPIGKNPAIAFLWLMVGLAPTVILLAFVSSSDPPPKWVNPVFVLLFCALCNLAGGIGCVRNIKDGLLRSILGLFLAFCFFVLSIVIALFQACSHMQF